MPFYAFGLAGERQFYAVKTHLREVFNPEVNLRTAFTVFAQNQVSRRHYDVSQSFLIEEPRFNRHTSFTKFNRLR